MAKTMEQKIIDSFYNASSSRFDPTSFAREMSNADTFTQYAFFKAMVSYIGYKAVSADYSQERLDPMAISSVCQVLRDEMVKRNIGTAAPPISNRLF